MSPLLDVFYFRSAKSQINSLADKIKKDEPIDEIRIIRLIRIIKRLERAARDLKADMDVIRSFCGGLADVLEKADELASNELFTNAMVSINGIKKISSEMLSDPEEALKEYLDLATIKVNIADLLKNLKSSLIVVQKEIREKVIEAAALR